MIEECPTCYWYKKKSETTWPENLRVIFQNHCKNCIYSPHMRNNHMTFENGKLYEKELSELGVKDDE